MSKSFHRSNTPIQQPAYDTTSKRLIVTANVTLFAIRDWSLWVLLRDGPWGPPMRLVLGTESVTDAVDRVLDALLLWPTRASLVQLKAGWQEQRVSVWGSAEQGAAVSLIHSVLLRANHDGLLPNLHQQAIPSLHVEWVPVAEVELGRRMIDPDVFPGLQTALHVLRSQVQRNPEIALRFLADMYIMPATEEADTGQGEQGVTSFRGKETRPLVALKEPETGDGILTLAEAALLYRAFFSPDEQIDLSNLRRRFLATNTLELLDEERPVRGREMDWRRVSRAYKYLG